MALTNRPIEWAATVAGSRGRLWVSIGVQILFVAAGFGAMYSLGVKSAELFPPKVVVLVVMRSGFLPIVMAGLIFPTLYIWCIHLLPKEVKKK